MKEEKKKLKDGRGGPSNGISNSDNEYRERTWEVEGEEEWEMGGEADSQGPVTSLPWWSRTNSHGRRRKRTALIRRLKAVLLKSRRRYKKFT